MRMNKFTVFTILTVLLLAGIFAPQTPTAVAAGEADAPQTVLVNLAFRDLPALGAGYVYEGWAIVAGAPVSTGTFTVSAAGAQSRTTFPLEADHRDVTAFVLTVEPVPDPDPAPSATHILAGDFDGRVAPLSAAHPAALGDDFLSASGTFILNAPSGASLGASYLNGIWWLDPATGPGPTLELPELPAGWSYEGWVVGPDGPISTGRFLDPAAADSDAGGPDAGPDGTPPFPGQDFVDPARDLTGYAAVISIEPAPDDSPAPFVFKPLVDAHISDPGGPGLSQEMANNAAAFPTGTATLAQAIRYEVTLTNLASGQPISPPVLATHKRSAALFAVGQPALPQIEAIAEDGDASGAADLLRSLGQVADVVALGMPLTPAGTQVGSFTDSVTVEIWARPGDRLTVAGMLICTNDGFSGLDRARLPLRGTAVYAAHAYDAGTELNSELSVDLVDPCSGLGPVVLDGDPNGNENAAVNTTGLIAQHPGITGNGDLLPAHDWDGAILEVFVKRID